MRKFDQNSAKDRIRTRRIELNISQEELGGRFGMSRAGYNAAESKTQNVFFTPQQIVNIKYELGLSYDYLLEGKESPAQKSKAQGGIEDDSLLNNKEKERLEEKIKSQEELIGSLKEQIELYKRMLSPKK